MVPKVVLWPNMHEHACTHMYTCTPKKEEEEKGKGRRQKRERRKRKKWRRKKRRRRKRKNKRKEKKRILFHFLHKATCSLFNNHFSNTLSLQEQ